MRDVTANLAGILQAILDPKLLDWMEEQDRKGRSSCAVGIKLLNVRYADHRSGYKGISLRVWCGKQQEHSFDIRMWPARDHHRGPVEPIVTMREKLAHHNRDVDKELLEEELEETKEQLRANRFVNALLKRAQRVEEE